MRFLPRAEITLPIVILAAALVLAASEFMVAFEFTPPGGEPLRDATAADRHGYSMLVLAICAIVATLIAITTGAKPAAYAVAGVGAVALLLFLILDLPDAGKLGDLEDPLRGIASAEANPQAGFWLQALGSTVLALGGAAFATLSPEQLRALPKRLGVGAGTGAGDGDAGDAGPSGTGAPYDERP